MKSCFITSSFEKNDVLACYLNKHLIVSLFVCLFSLNRNTKELNIPCFSSKDVGGYTCQVIQNFRGNTCLDKTTVRVNVAGQNRITRNLSRITPLGGVKVSHAANLCVNKVFHVLSRCLGVIALPFET